MSDQRSRAIEILDALWSRGDQAPVRAAVGPEFSYSLSSNGENLDLEAYLALVTGFRAAFDPIDLIFHKVLVEDGKVSAHYSLTGVHVGPVFGIEPTGTHLWVPAMTFMYFDSGQKLSRQVSLTDFLSLRRQLRTAA